METKVQSTTSRLNQLIKEVAAGGASMEERRAAAWLEPISPISTESEETTASSSQDYLLQLWMEACTHGDRDAFIGMLKDRGLTLDQAYTGLAKVRVKDGADMPSWVEALQEMLSATLQPSSKKYIDIAASLTSDGMLEISGDTEIAVPEGIGSVAIAPLIEVAHGWLDTSINKLQSCSISKYDVNGIVKSLIKYLVGHILHITINCILNKELLDVDAEAPTFNEWAMLLEKYPALGRAVGILAVQWRDFSEELLNRLHEDSDKLCRMLDTVQPVRSDSFKNLGTGDRHDGGRFVVPVDFGEGKILLYKPKDLRLGGSLSRLIDALGLDLQLPNRLERNDYIWEEVADTQPPSDGQQWDSLAREVGMWACLFTVLGSSDMLKCNVIVSRGRLIPVDTETIIPFLFVDPSILPWLPAASKTGLLSAPLVSKGRLGLGDWGIMADKDYLPLHERIHLIQEGYSIMHDRLVSNRDKILELVEDFTELPVRAVLRNTWVYFQLLMSSLSPESMVNGIERDLILERLWRAQQRFSLPVPIVESELSSLRDINIPLFRFYPGRRDIVNWEKGVAGDVLFEPPLEDIRRHVREMPDHPSEEDMDSLSALAFCALPDYQYVNSLDTTENKMPDNIKEASRPAYDAKRGTTQIDWLTKAHQSALCLYDILRHGGPDKSRLNASTTYVPANSMFVLSPIRSNDLLSGSAGLAAVLCHITKLTGDENLADEATFQIEYTAERCLHLTEAMANWTGIPSEAPEISFYTGLPSSLYALAFCKVECECIGSCSDTLKVIDQALHAGLVALGGFDFEKAFTAANWLKIAPATSLLISLSDILTIVSSQYACNKTESTSASNVVDLSTIAQLYHVASNLAQYIVDKWGNYFPDFANPVVNDLCPSGKSLAALALSRYYNMASATNVSHQSNISLNTIANKVTTYLKTANFDYSSDRIIAISLQKLFTIAHNDATSDSAEKTLSAYINHILDTSPVNTNTSSDIRLAHTMSCLSVMEELLTYHRLFPNNQYLDTARSIGKLISNNKDTYGKYFPENHLPDRYRLSAIWGMAGVVHAMSGLADPNSWRSLRLLELP